MTRTEKPDGGFDDPDAYDVPGFRPTPKPGVAADPVGLQRTIALHRNLAADDAHISRLVSSQPPTTLDVNTGVLHQEPAAAVGMTVSARLLRYVGHPEAFGSDFPWHKALHRLRYQCRKNHEFHRAADRPYWRGSLCHQLVMLTVIRRFSIQNAAVILRYDNPEPVLREALHSIEDSIDDYRAKAEKRERELQGHGPGAVPVPVPRHHIVDGLHQQDCPQCRAA